MVPGNVTTEMDESPALAPSGAGYRVNIHPAFPRTVWILEAGPGHGVQIKINIPGTRHSLVEKGSDMVPQEGSWAGMTLCLYLSLHQATDLGRGRGSVLDVPYFQLGWMVTLCWNHHTVVTQHNPWESQPLPCSALRGRQGNTDSDFSTRQNISGWHSAWGWSGPESRAQQISDWV